MTVVEQLKAAKALIEDPKHWTRLMYACDARGISCEIAEGVRFCAAGALLRAASRDKSAIWDWGFTPLRVLSRVAGSQGVAGINDYGGHAAVMKLYDDAIAIAEAAEAEEKKE